MNSADLLHAFNSWELATRGHKAVGHRVPIEPAYRPLLAEYRQQRPIVDDARKPGLWERLTRRVNVPETAPVLETDEASLNMGGASITELQLLAPREFSASGDIARQCLSSLRSIDRRLSFEVVGKEKQAVVQIACDASDRSDVVSCLRAYFPDIRVRNRPDGLLDAWPRSDGWAAVLHLGLTQRVFRSLRVDVKAESDPLIELVGRMASLAEGELGLVQVLFEGSRGAWGDDLVQFARSIEDVDHVMPQIEAKFRQPLFAAVVRVAAIAADEARATSLVRSFAAGVITTTRSPDNELVSLVDETCPIEVAVQDIVDRETRRPGFLVSLAELTTLAHVPSASVRSEALVRQSTRTRSAPATRSVGDLSLGINEHEGDVAFVRLPTEDRLRHIYSIGASGTGKSTLLLSMAIQDIEAGRGFAVLDPHGDLIEDILARIPPERASDVILFDPSDESYPVGFNVLSAHSELERTLLASDLVGVFRRFSTTFGDQMVSVLGNAILAFLESSEGGTLLDLRDFLVDKAYRARVLETVDDDEVVHYWEREFPLLKGLPHASILTRLNGFLRPKTIRYMVAQRRDNLDVRRIMDGSKILLAKLSHGAIGEDNAYMLGSLLVARIAQAAMSRQDENAESRVPFFLYMDEFHHFVTPSIAAILSGARKYGLGLVLSHQEIRQVKSRSDDIFSAVLGNAYTRIVFRVGEHDAKTLADGFSFFEARDLQNLGLGEAITRIERPDFDFNLRTVRPLAIDASVADQRKQAVRSASRAAFATPRSVIDDVLRRSREAREDADSATSPLNGSTGRKASEPSVAVPEPPAPTRGRGGPRHKYYQDLIKKLAEDRGYSASLEKHVLDGHGYVDVLLEREDLRIGCEISVTTSFEHEVRNLSKCLAAGLDYAVLISTSKRVLSAALAEFEHADDRVRFLVPGEFVALLDELDGVPTQGDSKSAPGKRSRGVPAGPQPNDRLAGRKILPAADAAAYLGLATQTLARMRVEGASPPFYKLGSRVMYQLDDLDAWVAERRRRSTSG